MRRPHLQLILASLLFPACAVEYDEDEFRYAPDSGGTSGGGTVFNTSELDKIGFSELTPKDSSDDPVLFGGQPSQASYMPGFKLEALVLAGGLALKGFTLDGYELVGVGPLNKLYKGEALLESTWTISRANTPHTMTLTSAETLKDVPRYEFTYTDELGVERSTCPPGPDGDGTARALPGFSLNENTGRITDAPETTYFACDTGATGKAADLGFYDLAVEHNKEAGIYSVKDGLLPWKPLEVAIRVLRADYCYTGDSYTKPHTPVWIEDRWGVIGPKPGKLGSQIEAIWGADGLLCRGVGRQVDLDEVDCELDIGETDPPMCKPGQTIDSFPGALFITRKIVAD